MTDLGELLPYIGPTSPGTVRLRVRSESLVKALGSGSAIRGTYTMVTGKVHRIEGRMTQYQSGGNRPWPDYPWVEFIEVPLTGVSP